MVRTNFTKTKDEYEVLTALEIDEIPRYVLKDKEGYVYYIQLEDGYIANSHGTRPYSYSYNPRLEY